MAGFDIGRKRIAEQVSPSTMRPVVYLGGKRGWGETVLRGILPPVV
jgi:hypothetical protein